MTNIIALASRVRGSLLARSTITYTFNFGMQLVIQFGYFILLSRFLGAEDYGTFITLSAVNGIAVLMIGLGSDHVMIQRVAVKPARFARFLGHSLTLSALTMPVVGIAAVLVGFALVGEQVETEGLFAFAAAHLICGRLVAICASAFMAFDRAKLQLLVNVGLAVLRALFLAFAVLFNPDLTLTLWAWWYLAASALGALAAVLLVGFVCGLPRLAIVRRDIGLGMQYCLEFVAIGSVADLDKPVVAHTLGADAAGQFAAGFKIADAASAPIRALLYATYTRHFRNASTSAAESVRFGRRLVPISLAISVPIAVFLYFVADYVPLLIGHDFDGTPQIIQLLALYPLLMGLSGIGADILRAVGKQRLRIALLVITAVTMMPAVWFGAVWGGLVGAGLARLVVQVLLVGSTWLFLVRGKTT